MQKKTSLTKNSLKKTTASDDDSSGSTGNAGSSIKMVDFLTTPEGELCYDLFLKKLREGEAKLGTVITPPVKKSPIQRASELSYDRFSRAHPFLRGLVRFNGIDRNQNPDVDRNPDAQNRLTEELKAALQMKKKLQSSMRPD